MLRQPPELQKFSFLTQYVFTEEQHLYSNFLITQCMQHNDNCDINGLVHDCSISIANALEILQSYTKPLTWQWKV